MTPRTGRLGTVIMGEANGHKHLGPRQQGSAPILNRQQSERTLSTDWRVHQVVFFAIHWCALEGTRKSYLEYPLVAKVLERQRPCSAERILYLDVAWQ